MIPTLLLACSGTQATTPCGEGFARADDGNCYEITESETNTESESDTDTDTDTDSDTDADTDTDTDADTDTDTDIDTAAPDDTGGPDDTGEKPWDCLDEPGGIWWTKSSTTYTTDHTGKASFGYLSGSGYLCEWSCDSPAVAAWLSPESNCSKQLHAPQELVLGVLTPHLCIEIFSTGLTSTCTAKGSGGFVAEITVTVY